MNCRDSIRGNPPLCCYSIGLTVFASSLLIGGWFMVTYPVSSNSILLFSTNFSLKDKVQDIDFIWALDKQNRSSNLTVPSITAEQAQLANDRIQIIG